MGQNEETSNCSCFVVYFTNSKENFFLEEIRAGKSDEKYGEKCW